MFCKIVYYSSAHFVDGNSDNLPNFGVSDSQGGSTSKCNVCHVAHGKLSSQEFELLHNE